jgi:hypothetical protein
MTEPDIDWSPFDAMGEQTLTCRCGATYRSHAKAIYGGLNKGIHARKPCPGCGESNGIIRASTDPEPMTISTEDQGGSER